MLVRIALEIGSGDTTGRWKVWIDYSSRVSCEEGDPDFKLVDDRVCLAPKSGLKNFYDILRNSTELRRDDLSTSVKIVTLYGYAVA